MLPAINICNKPHPLLPISRKSDLWTVLGWSAIDRGRGGKENN